VTAPVISPKARNTPPVLRKTVLYEISTERGEIITLEAQ
jgi:hypothetical protein